MKKLKKQFLYVLLIGLIVDPSLAVKFTSLKEDKLIPHLTGSKLTNYAHTFFVKSIGKKLFVFEDGYLMGSNIDSSNYSPCKTEDGSFINLSYSFAVASVPEQNILVVVDYKGTVNLIKPGDTSKVLFGKITLTYFGYYSYNYIYKIEKKPQTNFFYITSTDTNILQKIDISNLNNYKTLLSNGPSESYESISLSSNSMILISSSGRYMEHWSLSTDTYLETLEIAPITTGSIYRSITYYPRITGMDYFFAPRSDLLCHMFNLEHKTIEKIFSTQIVNPEQVKYIEYTTLVIMFGSNLYEIFDLEENNLPASDGVFLRMSLVTNYIMNYADATFIINGDYTYMAVIHSYDKDYTIIYDLETKMGHYSGNECTQSLLDTKGVSGRDGFTLNSGKCVQKALDGKVTLQDGTSAFTGPQGSYHDFAKLGKHGKTDGTQCQNYTGICNQGVAGKVIGPNGNCISDGDTNFYNDNGIGKNGHVSGLTGNGPNSNNGSSGTAELSLSGSNTGDLNLAGLKQHTFDFFQKKGIKCVELNCREGTNQNIISSGTKGEFGFVEMNGSGYGRGYFGSVNISSKGVRGEEIGKIFKDDSCIPPDQGLLPNLLVDLKCEVPIADNGSNSSSNGNTGSNSTNLNGNNNSEDQNYTNIKKDDSGNSSITLTIIIIGIMMATITGLCFSVVYIKNRKRNQIANAQINNEENGSESERDQIDSESYGFSLVPIKVVNLVRKTIIKNEFVGLKNLTKKDCMTKVSETAKTNLSHKRNLAISKFEEPHNNMNFIPYIEGDNIQMQPSTTSGKFKVLF